MNRDKRPNRGKEREAVFTTIVGGRPPGSGTDVGAIPRGVEVLLKKASVDAEFRKLLLEKRGDAAGRIDLDLTEAERAMLAAISAEQLERIIDNTKVKPEHKAVFMGSVGRIMLAAVIGVAALSVMMPTLGHTLTPEQRERVLRQYQESANALHDANDPNASASDSQARRKEPDPNEP
jgi:hypothetical protein